MSDWQVSHRADPVARVIADRHYNRQSIGAVQFVPPGRCLVLLIPGKALWVTSWPFAEYVKHEWAGAMVCSTFRNEAPDEFLSSELIRQACAVTRWQWPEIPELGMVTFVNERVVRHKRDPGRCYRKAGFMPVGRTKTRDYVALQLLPADWPEAEAPLGSLDAMIDV